MTNPDREEHQCGLTFEEARRDYIYDPDTGLVWRRGRKSVTTNRSAARYRQIRIGDRTFLLHRFIWFYVHGAWPAHFIDHINGDKSDNRLVNLRLATKAENGWNVPRKIGKHGYRGVFKAPKSPLHPYFAKLRKNGSIVRTSQFATIEEAAIVYDRLARLHHGEFAILNFPDAETAR